MRRFRRLAVDEIKDEEEGYKGTSAAIQRTREALEHLRKVRRNGSGIQVEDEFEETELLEAARKRAAACEFSTRRVPENWAARPIPTRPKFSVAAWTPSDVSRVKLAAATDETAVKARELAREAAETPTALAKDSEAKVSAAKAAQKRAGQAADAVAAARLDRARRVPPSSVDSSEPSRDADSEAAFAAAAARRNTSPTPRASAAADATREAIAAEANAAAAKAIATSAAGMSQVADAVALEVHDARARADASSVRAKEALARVAKARAGAARPRELAEDASRNMSADPDTVSEIRGQADSSTAQAIALERDAALARAEADAHEKTRRQRLNEETRSLRRRRDWNRRLGLFGRPENGATTRINAYKQPTRSPRKPSRPHAPRKRSRPSGLNGWSAPNATWKVRNFPRKPLHETTVTRDFPSRGARRSGYAPRLKPPRRPSSPPWPPRMPRKDRGGALEPRRTRRRRRGSRRWRRRLCRGVGGGARGGETKVDTLRRRADAAERSARVHVELAAEAAAYGRELNSDPAFRARRRRLRAAVVEAENFLRDAELKKLRAIAEAKEVRRLPTPPNEPPRASPPRRLSVRSSFAPSRTMRRGNTSRFRRPRLTPNPRLRGWSRPTTRSRCTATWASSRGRNARAQSPNSPRRPWPPNGAPRSAGNSRPSRSTRARFRSVAAAAETAPAEMTAVAAAVHELLSAVGADAKRSHGLADAERADAYLLASVARWREEAARLATERSRVEVAAGAARDRKRSPHPPRRNRRE